MQHVASEAASLPSLDLPAAGLDVAAPVDVGGRRLAIGAAVLAVVAFSAVSVLLAATSEHVQYPTATALY